MKDNLLQSSLRMCLVEFKYDVMTALEKDVQFATNFAWILIEQSQCYTHIYKRKCFENLILLAEGLNDGSILEKSVARCICMIFEVGQQSSISDITDTKILELQLLTSIVNNHELYITRIAENQNLIDFLMLQIGENCSEFDELSESAVLLGFILESTCKEVIESFGIDQSSHFESNLEDSLELITILEISKQILEKIIQTVQSRILPQNCQFNVLKLFGTTITANNSSLCNLLLNQIPIDGINNLVAFMKQILNTKCTINRKLMLKFICQLTKFGNHRFLHSFLVEEYITDLIFQNACDYELEICSLSLDILLDISVYESFYQKRYHIMGTELIIESLQNYVKYGEENLVGIAAELLTNFFEKSSDISIQNNDEFISLNINLSLNLINIMIETIDFCIFKTAKEKHSGLILMILLLKLIKRGNSYSNGQSFDQYQLAFLFENILKYMSSQCLFTQPQINDLMMAQDSQNMSTYSLSSILLFKVLREFSDIAVQMVTKQAFNIDSLAINNMENKWQENSQEIYGNTFLIERIIKFASEYFIESIRINSAIINETQLIDFFSSVNSILVHHQPLSISFYQYIFNIEFIEFCFQCKRTKLNSECAVEQCNLLISNCIFKIQSCAFKEKLTFEDISMAVELINYELAQFAERYLENSTELNSDLCLDFNAEYLFLIQSSKPIPVDDSQILISLINKSLSKARRVTSLKLIKILMQQKNLPMNGLENILNFIAENCFELAQDLDKNTLLFALKHLRKQNMQEYFTIEFIKQIFSSQKFDREEIIEIAEGCQNFSLTVLEAHEKIDDFFKSSPILLEIMKTILTSQINSDLKEKLCSIPIQQIFDYLNSPDNNKLIHLLAIAEFIFANKNVSTYCTMLDIKKSLRICNLPLNKNTEISNFA